MPDDRQTIFSAIQDALAPLKERTPYPEWDESIAISHEEDAPTDPWKRFAWKLKQVNGTPLVGLEQLGVHLRESGCKKGYCAPEWIEKVKAMDAFAGFELETQFDRNRIDEYEFGITEATGAITETGTIILTDKDTPTRLAALAPWAHAALIKEATLHSTVAEAIAKTPYDPSTIWCTGPSKTADVEGILIEGVHGPGVQIGCLV